MVIGTSLTFYRGAESHDAAAREAARATGLPVSTMSQAVVDGLRAFGARRIAVAHRLCGRGEQAPRASSRRRNGFEVLALEGFGLFGFGEPGRKSEADIIALSIKVCAEAPAAEGLLISCGGLRTLGVAKPIEERHGIPVVSSTQAAFWAAMRLVGESGQVAGYGRLLEQSAAPCTEASSMGKSSAGLRADIGCASIANDSRRRPERQHHEGARHRHAEIRHPRSRRARRSRAR